MTNREPEGAGKRVPDRRYSDIDDGLDKPAQRELTLSADVAQRRAQKDRPMAPPILMILPDHEPGLSQAAALAEQDALNVAVVGQAGGIRADTLAQHALLLVWVAGVHAVGLPTILQAARPVRTVLALTHATLLEAADMIGYFDAALFVDQPIARQVAALDIAGHGHSVLPGYIDHRFTPDSLRSTMADTLHPRERIVLRSLATGATNTEIARALGMSEAGTKGSVRTILNKLHLRNRTEAALFAVRNAGRLGGAGHAGPDLPSFRSAPAPVCQTHQSPPLERGR